SPLPQSLHRTRRVDGAMGQGVRVNGNRTAPPSVAVVGAGTLGLSVVHACLVAGSPVTLLVRGREAAVEKARQVGRSLQRHRPRQVLPAADASAAGGRLRVATDTADLARADVLLECVPEEVAAKRAVIAAAESVVDRACLIASTTSSIPSATLAVGAR